MNENELALELFLTTSPVRAKEIIKNLTKLKEKQKKLTQEIVDKLTMSQLNSQVNNKFYYFIVRSSRIARNSRAVAYVTRC